MAEREKRKLFAMDEDDLADALEAIYKRQKNVEVTLEEIKTHLVAMRTTVVNNMPPSPAADSGAVEDDGIPPVVKWALGQPWGVALMHGLTDQQMITGLVQGGIEWLKKKAAEKAVSS